MSHTPGPWTVAGTAHSVSKTFGVKSADALWVAKCHPFNGQTDDRATAKANARLMAAAPDLLEALKRLEFVARDTIGADGALLMVCDNARAAIAKAEAKP